MDKVFGKLVFVFHAQQNIFEIMTKSFGFYDFWIEKHFLRLWIERFMHLQILMDILKGLDSELNLGCDEGMGHDFCYFSSEGNRPIVSIIAKHKYRNPNHNLFICYSNKISINKSILINQTKCYKTILTIYQELLFRSKIIFRLCFWNTDINSKQ